MLQSIFRQVGVQVVAMGGVCKVLRVRVVEGGLGPPLLLSSPMLKILVAAVDVNDDVLDCKQARVKLPLQDVNFCEESFMRCGGSVFA